jgi:transmembrane sensor
MSTASNAAGINARAAAWLERRDGEDWNAEDQIALDAWLAESRAHVAAYWRLKAAWGHASRLVALKPSDLEEPRTRRISPILQKAAGGVAAAALLAVAGALYLNAPRTQTYATTLGGHETLRLADGSRIELNTDTVLRLVDGPRGRKAWLDHGEAYFEIKHDAAHPFVLTAADHRVTDIGTKFVVRQDGGQLKVSLVEGRVRFESDSRWDRTGPALLAPGDVAVATATSMSVTKEPTQKLASEFGWRRGVLVFKYTSLADAAAEFNRYNPQKLIVADRAAARLTIVGTFGTTDVSAFVAAAKSLFGLRMKQGDEETVISR